MRSVVLLILAATSLCGQFAVNRGMKTSSLNNHWALQGRGLVISTDCLPTPNAEKNMALSVVRPLQQDGVPGRQATLSTQRPSVYDPVYGCIQNGQHAASGGGAAFPFNWVWESRMGPNNASWAMLYSVRKMSSDAMYMLGYGTNNFNVIVDYAANTTEFFAGGTPAGYSGTNPRTNSGLAESALGTYGVYQWAYDGPGSWKKSKDGASWTVNRDTFTLNATYTSANNLNFKTQDSSTIAPWQMVTALAYWNRGLTERDAVANNRAVARRMAYAGATRTDYDGIVVFIGDSLTIADSLFGDYDNRYPNKVMVNLRADRWLDWYSYATSSVYMSSINTYLATGPQTLYGLRGTGTGKTNVAVLWACTNDIFLGGATSAACQTSFTTVVNALKATGWKVVALNIIPRNANGAGDAGFDTIRQDWNAWYASNCAGIATACVDLTSDAAFAGDRLTANNTTYYLSDKIHLTVAGYDIVANKVITAIRSIW